MSLGVDPGNAHRMRLAVLAGAVTALVWDLNGSGEVAIATAALVLQLIEMAPRESL